MDRGIHLPDYSFPGQEQGSLQLSAFTPCCETSRIRMDLKIWMTELESENVWTEES